MPHIELAVPIALGVGLAAATGFRVFLPMLLVSAAAYTGHLYGYGPGRYAAPRLLSQVRSLYRLQSLRHRSFRHRRRPRVRQVAGNTPIGTASIASTRATIALTWGRDRKEGCQRCWGPCLNWSSIFSTSRRQASCSRGPAVFSTAIWR